ncbi:ImmA/IrrE family metallo-endopeptidase [Tetragenococcus halophilus]|uniref:ImmA/IrrE family metallo-endopeptidase n=2 Tax=Tetragenococcus halophilus TaxID=51669 RepID=A0AB37D456_TETHA|nr:ImmA/IrrE family metallo-endopeptidase [Tetragenococcus halophilus]MCO8289101.1 ImmA/IrrE family metallo-endopeptidase [Tetragenococcus halophilus]MCO8292561.1 ImmA/IrrE family metallo-endopeptidase [Tetragenococcus halophilus]MDN6163115.1 ImmA/IrrE family metallo-endopeptidase [Tetragenococcus halophilus]MDN6724698.1 ImmA/IrrE family metallo-endopeptidase [Tetragenococcus halophilus]QGP76164.1 ImmA/IrrE family metallo-endopeptidase [Tetragenococcus halophilus]
MVVARVPITPHVIKYYIDTSNINLEDLEKDANLKNINGWLDLSAQPTFNQLNQLSKKIKVPFGYLLLNDIQKEEPSLIEYRTVLNNEVDKPSRDLLETIDDMEDKQDWMRDFLIRNSYEKLNFVNKFSKKDSVQTIAQGIRHTLQLEETWFVNRQYNNAFNYLRDKFENAGILVMQNGVVKANTHRNLNVDEFRAFVLVDDYAPLIFINSTDSNGGKIFSLFHEVAHIFLGESDLFNDNNVSHPIYRNDLEVLCNDIASELCIPAPYFKELWAKNTERDTFNKIHYIAQKCKISILAVAVKALKNRYIDEQEYYKIRNESLKYYKKENTKKKENNGNGINTAVSRIDKRFFQFLSNDIKSGNTQYTDAYRLLNTNRKTFDKIERKILEGKS